MGSLKVPAGIVTVAVFPTGIVAPLPDGMGVVVMMLAAERLGLAEMEGISVIDGSIDMDGESEGTKETDGTRESEGEMEGWEEMDGT